MLNKWFKHHQDNSFWRTSKPTSKKVVDNSVAISLIKKWEGCKLRSYLDGDGVWTIGYGWAETNGMEPRPKAGMVITKQGAEELLDRYLTILSKDIDKLFTRQPTPNQRGAMMSLAYNIGTNGFAKSTCLRRFNKGDIAGAAEALTWFKMDGGKVVQGLVNRRADEKRVFLLVSTGANDV
jgi:lysozyme